VSCVSKVEGGRSPTPILKCGKGKGKGNVHRRTYNEGLEGK